MSRRRLALAALALAIVWVAAPPCAQAQCAMCQTALTSSPEGRGISVQFNHAILVMLFAPYVVMGALAGVVFRSHLRLAWLRLRTRLRPRATAPRLP